MDEGFSLDEPKLFDWGWVMDNFSEEILPALIQHVIIAVSAVAIALAIAVPAGILAHHRRSLYPPMTIFTGLLFTIPSLAFFVILISVPGIGLGRTPAIIALVAYSLLILIRNVVTGLDSVPADTIDAARGMGLTQRQILFGVELPLALPVIVAGVRVSVVTVIGIAAIAAYIGAGGLGALIFDGIDRQFPTLTITGAVLSAALAIVADLSLAWLSKRLRPWTKKARA